MFRSLKIDLVPVVLLWLCKFVKKPGFLGFLVVFLPWVAVYKNSQNRRQSENLKMNQRKKFASLQGEEEQGEWLQVSHQEPRGQKEVVEYF